MLADQKNYRERTFSVGENLSKRVVDKQMKSNINNVEALKNRLKVLSSQADYNRFRSKFQTEKIERHQKIHEQAITQKHQIVERLKTRVNTEEKKEKTQKIKIELKQKLNEVYQRLKDEKSNNRNNIRVHTEKNRELLAKRKAKDLQKRRNMKMSVLQMQNGIRKALERYSQQKIEDIKAIQEQQKKHLLNYSSEIARQMQLLSQKEKELIDLNSQSMQNSRLLDIQFKRLYTSKSKDISLQLPEIRKKSPNHSTSTQFD